MTISIRAATLVAALLVAGDAAAQGMLLDFAADKVIKKYQSSSCDQLKALKGEPPSEKEKMAIDFLRDDAQARQSLHRQDRRAGFEQDVRMRADPVRVIA